MLEAPPNRKATFPAIAKAWPCLLKMTRTIRKSNYQLPHFFFYKKPHFINFLCLQHSTTWSFEWVYVITWFKTIMQREWIISAVWDCQMLCYCTKTKWQTLDMGRLLSSLFPATDRLLMPSSHLLCLCLSLLHTDTHTHTEHTVSPINQSF